MKGCKICGISDLDTLNFIINHPYSSQFIGFICNYKKSPRYVEVEKLNELLKLDKKKSNFVAVLVKPDENILEEIKHLPFDYYQIYDCTPEEIKEIKLKHNKKIITALTVSNQDDINKYKAFEDVADILLFDSKGYEKTQSFNHNFLDNSIIVKVTPRKQFYKNKFRFQMIAMKSIATDLWYCTYEFLDLNYCKY